MLARWQVVMRPVVRPDVGDRFVAAVDAVHEVPCMWALPVPA